ncbi:uncharacterized protein LAESUDRAFT_809619 [Laetiporus sulphureus 93-53]|uniref:Heat shock protein 9/12 n=1 Tax=Laetiporus sulphureus 93-53 TaxID=1314785 RepID=A0A165GR76_9APHY|nr:uncharacterized protein LAESUDRAFT_809619 [Laetiporus sulphureus 93-53]KZT10695.1 hypothetical protein LAESUDRAFT_809619 [Laetiporus sulphureus 93-53]
MSDTGRQSFGDKIGAAVKPDSQKTTTESLGDTIKGKSDNAAGAVEPESQKSYAQQLGDKFSSNPTEPSMLDKAKNAVGMGSNKNV